MKIEKHICDGCSNEINREEFKSKDYGGTSQGFTLTVRRNLIMGSGTGECMEYFIDKELCGKCKDSVVAHVVELNIKGKK